MFNYYIFFSFIHSIRYANNKINFLKSAEKSFPQIYLEDKFGKYFFPKCIDLLDGFIPLLHAFHTIITLHKVCMLANFFSPASINAKKCLHVYFHFKCPITDRRVLTTFYYTWKRG